MTSVFVLFRGERAIGVFGDQVSAEMAGAELPDGEELQVEEWPLGQVATRFNTLVVWCRD